MVNLRHRLWLGTALMVSAAVCCAASSQPQVFRCVDGDGHVIFSDTDCGSTKEKVEIVESSGGLSPIKDAGLTAQEKATLGAIEARDARIASERASGAGQGARSAPAAPPSSEAPKRTY